ncbi:MAG TPA: hypothetical protein DCX67_00970 [Opitutae bacterium]|nr:hypothetical protein [Opitutae bacterium]
MSYRMGLMDDYRSERFITFSEASEILGIRSYSRVSKMVKAGTLAAFELPDTDRLRVRKSDVMALIHKSSASQNG